MILKKDSLSFGLILGAIGPLLGLLVFKMYKFGIFSFREFFQFLMVEPGFRTLSVALSLALLANALLFTIYINMAKDKTARGIFVFTLFYGLIILLIKTFY